MSKRKFYVLDESFNNRLCSERRWNLLYLVLRFVGLLSRRRRARRYGKLVMLSGENEAPYFLSLELKPSPSSVLIAWEPPLSPFLYCSSPVPRRWGLLYLVFRFIGLLSRCRRARMYGNLVLHSHENKGPNFFSPEIEPLTTRPSSVVPALESSIFSRPFLLEKFSSPVHTRWRLLYVVFRFIGLLSRCSRARIDGNLVLHSHENKGPNFFSPEIEPLTTRPSSVVPASESSIFSRPFLLEKFSSPVRTRWRMLYLVFRFIGLLSRCSRERIDGNLVLHSHENKGPNFFLPKIEPLTTRPSSVVPALESSLFSLPFLLEKFSSLRTRWGLLYLVFRFIGLLSRCRRARRRHPMIKNWQKGKELGSGSFSTVYEAFTEDGFFFAVKEVSLHDQDSQGHQNITLVEQEISLLSLFRHENIVSYLGSDKDDSRFYIFLELITQGSLARLYQKYQLQDSHVSTFTRQILRGLNYLHCHNVVHRDIKCANILVDVSGSVKLADFGLAKVTKVHDIKSSRGSPFWMAPEVVNPKNSGYGTAADIWSLGCTVLEMLTRQIPYSNLEVFQALYKIGRGEGPIVPSDLSREAQDFIHKCLQVNPDDRPTAAQLLEHPLVSNQISSKS